MSLSVNTPKKYLLDKMTPKRIEDIKKHCMKNFEEKKKKKEEDLQKMQESYVTLCYLHTSFGIPFFDDHWVFLPKGGVFCLIFEDKLPAVFKDSVTAFKAYRSWVIEHGIQKMKEAAVL